MKTSSILLCLTFSLLMLGCAPKRPYVYAVIEPYMHENLYAQGQYGKYIIVEDSYSPELKEAFDFVSSGPYVKSFARKDASLITNESERDLFLGFLNMESRDFEQALFYFKRAAANGIHQANILWLDCQLEMGAEMDYLSAYQDLYDNTTDPLLRKVVKSRYQYYRHGL